LRQVHCYDFYSGEQYDDERGLASKVGPAHIRSSTRNDGDSQETKAFEEKYRKAASSKIESGPIYLSNPDDQDDPE
jgi:hypothetical protein